MKGLKIINSNRIHSGEVSLRLDKFVLDGNSIEKEIVEHRNSVGILPLVDAKGPSRKRENESVILVTQYRRAANSVMLEIPAGKLEQGETPLQAAKRELGEEIGYKATTLKPLVRCYLAPGYDTEFMTIFLAWGLSHTPRGKLDDDENIKMKHISMRSALRKCFSGEIRDCKTIAALSAYHATKSFPELARGLVQ